MRMSKEWAQYRDSQSLAYILSAREYFSPVGYKVLQSQLKRGFVRCTRVIHNGKDKLVYDISNLRPLDTFFPSLSQDKFLSIFSNLLDVVLEVKGNGFMRCDNIDVSLDKIFVDPNNLKVYVIYLPVEETVDLFGNGIFEESLVRVMRNAMNQIDAPNSSLREILDEGANSLEQILQRIRLTQSESSRSHMNIPEMVTEVSEPSHEKVKKGLFSDIFAKKTKEENPETETIREKRVKVQKDKASTKKKQDYGVMQTMAQGGATELLDDFFVPSLLLVGIKTSEKMEIAVSKQEFTLGKKVDAVDYAITTNNAISRTHCKIIFEKGGSFILDLSSVNGTYINGVKLTPNTKTPIKVGDKLRLANLEFLVKAI